MHDKRDAHRHRRAEEFEAFVAGAAGRLLHLAALLTAEPNDRAPRAERLLATALSHTYARWERLRDEDPYAYTRQELASRFALTPWRYRRVRGGPLERLTPRERLVLVLRLHEGVSEEQTAAGLGIPVDQVRSLCTRAVARLRSHPQAPAHRRRIGAPS